MKAAIVAVYRIRGVLYIASVLVLLAIAFLGPLLPDGPFRDLRFGAVIIAVGTMLASLLLGGYGPAALPEPEGPTVVAPPVRGRWLAVNSPASQVPSHGVRGYGQAYAIDLVHEPDDDARPVYGDGPAMRRPEEYPAFGQPVYAMIDGVVVGTANRRRDHRARSNRWGMLYLIGESAVRSFGGPAAVLGNHVTIRGDDGIFATVAHLQRGSVEVAVGDRVEAGRRIGRCGNSGNSTEPHVHAQLMDRASVRTGQGLPLAFAEILLEPTGDERTGDEPIDTGQVGCDPVDAVPTDHQRMIAAGSDS